MSEFGYGEWRVADERDLGTFAVRLEILNEPTKAAVGRSIGRVLLDVVLGGYGGFSDTPSYSPSRVVKVWRDRPSEPEVFEYGHDYESARLSFRHLIAEADGQPDG
ncbi:MAG: hypothetical protein ACXVXP_06850 [Mycobacteriaceae bacterium]